MLPFYIRAVSRRAPGLDIRDLLITAIRTSNRELINAFGRG